MESSHSSVVWCPEKGTGLTARRSIGQATYATIITDLIGTSQLAFPPNKPTDEILGRIERPLLGLSAAQVSQGK
jgi:hypothetical protein